MTAPAELVAALFLLAQEPGPARLLDGFERLDGWTPHPADGVALAIRSDRGRRGRAMRLDFDFAGSGGYAVARRALALDLPPDYAFSFWIRGHAPPNTIEFKLLDASGENVWWYTEREVVFDGAWRKMTIRRRQITFAWGPRGGGELDHAATLELVITAGRGGGGTGTVWIDDLILTPRSDLGPYTLTPRVTASAALGGAGGHAAPAALDGDTLTSWRAPRASLPATLRLDFLRAREFGGLTLVWESDRAARAYAVFTSDDGRRWREIARVRESDGGYDHLFLPDTEARYLRLVVERIGPGGVGAVVGLRELRVEPLEVGASRNAFFSRLAHDAPAGSYPRAFLGQRAAWTVVGVDGAREEALLNEDGALETGEAAFSIEPFLRVAGGLLTWRDVERDVWLERGDLPIPAVRWRAGPLSLTISAFAIGPDSASSVVARYRVANAGDTALGATLYLAVRPFQVNPPFQFLNVAGGVARIDSLRWDGCHLLVNGDRSVVPLTPPARVGVTTFEGGEIAEHLRRGVLPARRTARDAFGAASAALAYPLRVPPRGSWTISLEVPLVAGASDQLEEGGEPAAALAHKESADGWDERLGHVITLPRAGERVAQTIRSTLAYILINRDGPAIQPGSRAYARSWIRDGALTSTALLRFGYPDVVRAFLEWYARHQYPNGKVPCCVDRRGADPVPEHDSHGEFIYLVAEYYRHTGDRALVERLWPNVLRAADYLDSLRQSRRTLEYTTGDRRMFFGLLPPSISHEGYSAKPMHSYWDDFFAVRGFKDATALARILGQVGEAERLATVRDEFQRELYASIEQVMAHHRIDYIPGAADLGDFDATSTTIAVAPGGELARLPRAALDRTFERYWLHATARRDSAATWESYTPYELRAVGTFVRLGWKDRALALLDGFLADQEPPAWLQWPEVVWRDRRAPKFIGDLPHTWVGADFLRSVADLFAWEREADSALVIGAGIPEAWLADSGVVVRGLSTWWGPLSFTARNARAGAIVRIGEGLRVPPGGLVVVSPRAQTPRQATVNGVTLRPDTNGAVVVRRVPADVTFEY